MVIYYQQALATKLYGGSNMSEVEKLQETLDCINQNLVVLVREQQLLYLLLEKMYDKLNTE